MVHELYMNKVLEKAEKPEIKLPTSAGLSKKQESSRKTSISALLTMPKPLTVWITTNCLRLVGLDVRAKGVLVGFVRIVVRKHHCPHFHVSSPY